MHDTFNNYIKSWVSGPMSKSPYSHKYNKEHGWSKAAEAYKTPFSAVHFDRAKIDSPATIKARFANFNGKLHFKCSRHAEMVDEVWYDPDMSVLKVQWKKARTGARGATEGSITYYDKCAQSVFEDLRGYANAHGHCGDRLWSIIRLRGDSQGHYTYTNQ